jgi:hypothetical protein
VDSARTEQHQRLHYAVGRVPGTGRPDFVLYSTPCRLAQCRNCCCQHSSLCWICHLWLCTQINGASGWQHTCSKVSRLVLHPLVVIVYARPRVPLAGNMRAVGTTYMWTTVNIARLWLCFPTRGSLTPLTPERQDSTYRTLNIPRPLQVCQHSCTAKVEQFKFVLSQVPKVSNFLE